MGNNLDYILKKIWTVILTVLLLFETVGINYTNVYADEVTRSISMNGVSLSSSETEIPYGNTISLSMTAPDKASDSTPAWMYVSGDTPDLEMADWITGVPHAPGSYYVAAKYTDADNVGHEIGSYNNEKFMIKIVAAQLGAPTNPVWNGNVLSWTAPTTTVSGAPLDADAIGDYTLDIYVNNEQTRLEYVSTNSFDFSEKIGTRGGGQYSVHIGVRAKEGDDRYYYSPRTDTVLFLPIIEISGGTGINSVEVDNPGYVRADSSATIGITVVKAEGYAGDPIWTKSDNIHITHVDGNRYNVSIDSSYIYRTAYIEASGNDVTAPVINSYTAENNELKVTASDTGSGVSQYAFSTSEDVLESGWVNENSYIPEGEGAYYAFVKDAFGNTAKSENTVNVYSVTYVNWQYNTDHIGYRAGEEEFTLSAPPTRDGYTFAGWYDNEGLTGTPVTSVSGNESNTVYAKWDRDDFNFWLEVDGVVLEGNTATVDWLEDNNQLDYVHHLEIKKDTSAGEWSYLWERKQANGEYKEIERTIPVTLPFTTPLYNGEYRVTVTQALDGVNNTKTKNVFINVRKGNLKIVAVPEVYTVEYGDNVPDLGVRLISDKQWDIVEPRATAETEYTKGSESGKTYKVFVDQDKIDKSEGSWFANISVKYNITFEDTYITVVKKQITENAVVVVMEEGPYIYKGSAYTPVQKILINNVEVDSDDYDIAYENNKAAGEATVSITFKNYVFSEGETATSTLTKHFTIEKQAYKPVISIDDYIYDGTTHEPTITFIAGDSDGARAFVYQKYVPGSEGSEGSWEDVSSPKDVGRYQVKLTVSADKNYDAIESDYVEFNINKRTVTLASNSGTWQYDGNSHTAQGYTTDNNFAPGEGFRTVSVTGSITEVGSTENTISFTLTSVTDENNYDFDITENLLTITTRKLADPTGAKWNASNPGKAEWGAVTKSGVTISYEVKLEKKNENGNFVQVGDVFETTSTNIDLTQYIKAQGVGEYRFAVSAKAIDGLKKDNYTQSDFAECGTSVNTAKVTFVNDGGFETVPADMIVLSKGNEDISATLKSAGYEMDKSAPVWSCTNSIVTITNNHALNTSITIGALTEPVNNITVRLHSARKKPEIVSFSANLDSDRHDGQIGLLAKDDIGIKGYEIRLKGSESGYRYNFDNLPDSKEVHSSLNISWVLAKYETLPNEFQFELIVYYQDGNVERSVVADETVDMYKVSFDKNNDKATGSMENDWFYKLKGESVTLPANKYTLANNEFKVWTGTNTGSYANGGVYTADKSDLLKAQWTDVVYNYTVEYYLGNTDTTYTDSSYPTLPAEEKTFKTNKGTSISVSSLASAVSWHGFTSDTTRNTGNVVIDEDNKVIKVYFARNLHSIAYHYTDINNNEVETSENYRYGKTGIADNKPTAEGYTFVGWFYGDAGKCPTTMPDADIAVTGRFLVNDTTYVVNYFQKDPGADTYTMLASRSETHPTAQGVEIEAGIKTGEGAFNTVKEFAGFTYAGVMKSEGVVGPTSNPTLSKYVIATASAVEGKTVNINYYYTRNQYPIKQVVYKDDAVFKSNIYRETVDYGTAISGAQLSELKDSAWITEIPNGYVLSTRIDFSTGEEPVEMPDSELTVKFYLIPERDYPYQIRFYKMDENGNYDETKAPEVVTINAKNGSVITLDPDNSGATGKKQLSELNGVIQDLNYYYVDTTKTNDLVATVDKNNVERDYIQIYLARKTYTAKINYEAIDLNGNKVYEKTTTLTGIWGSTFTADQLKEIQREFGFTGNTPVTGSYCEKNYVVSYNAYYITSLTGSWPTWNADSVADLEALSNGYLDDNNRVMYFGHSDATHLDVHFTEVRRDNYDYYFEINNRRSQAKNIKSSAEANFNDELFKARAEGTDEKYVVRFVNHNMIFKDTPIVPETEIAYPGLSIRNVKFNISNELRDGWQAVSAEGKTYYKCNDSNNSLYGDGNYLYIYKDTSNSFYDGQYVNISAVLDEKTYGTDQLYKREVRDFVNGLINADEINYANLHVSNASTSVVLKSSVKGNTIPVNYSNELDLSNVWIITYEINGTADVGHYVTRNRLYNVGCNDVSHFPQREGYQIVWYEDGNYLTKAPDQARANANKTYHGRYEQIDVTLTQNNLYELSETVTVNDISYLDYLNNVAVSYVIEHKSELTDFVVNEDNSVIKYKGDVVATITDRTCLSFSEQKLNTVSAVEGYFFDDENVNNISSTLMGATSKTVDLFFKADNHVITIYPENSEDGSVVYTSYNFKTNTTFEIADPSKEGYIFNNWKFEAKKANGTWEEVSVSKNGSLYKFGSTDLRATAQYTPKSYAKNIIRYYQTVSGIYEKSLVADIKAGTAGSRGTSETDGGVIYYKNSDGKVVATEITTSQHSTGTNVSLVDYAATYEPFSFNFATVETNREVKTINATGENSYITWSNYIRNIEYFYLRPTNCNVSAIAIASDGNSNTGATILGGGSYPYEADVTLSVTIADGYQFLGWYNASDFDEDGKLISGATVNPISTDKTLPRTATVASQEYVAYTKANEISLDADVTISGANSVVYTYGSTTRTPLTVVATPNPGCYISAYQWYMVTTDAQGSKVYTPVTGATTATYNFPNNNNVGVYTYVCEVTATRYDNGRSITKRSSEFSVTITPGQIQYSSRPFTGVYDGNAHSASVSVEKLTDYNIYYSVSEINANNPTGSSETPEFTEVNFDSETNSVVPYIVHFLITADNFAPASGTVTVLIKPRPLSLELRTGGSYSKQYDGTASITDNDRAELLKTSNFNITNLVSGDHIDQYTLSCNDAYFNSKDVEDASVVTMSVIVLLKDGVVNHNYQFGEVDGADFIISGDITPYNLTPTWGTTDLVYNGQVQNPTATLSKPAGSIAETENVGLSYTGSQLNAGEDYVVHAEVTSSATGFKSSNYHLVNDTISYNISRRPIKVVPGSDVVEYDGSEHTLTVFNVDATTEGMMPLADGHTLSAEGNTKHKNVGEYNVLPDNIKVMQGATNVTENYIIDGTSSNTLTITRKPMTFSGVIASNKKYDGNTNAQFDSSNVEYSGIVGRDNVAIDFSKITASFNNANVGNRKPVTLSYGDNSLTSILIGENKDNYSVNWNGSETGLEANITSENLTVHSTNSQTVTYGDGNAVFTHEWVEFAEGDNEGNSITGEMTYKLVAEDETEYTYGAKTPVGTYTVVPVITGLSSNNYSLSVSQNNNATLTIIPREITVGANSKSTQPVTKQFDNTKTATLSATDYAFDNVVEGDSVALTYSAEYAGVNVSNNNPVTVTGLSTNNSNYTLTTTTFTVPGKIIPRQVNATVESMIKKYGDNDPTFYVTIGSTPTPIIIEGAFTYSRAPGAVVGNYEITGTCDQTINPNYEITVEPGTLTIQKRPVYLIVADKTITYGENPGELTYTYEPYNGAHSTGILPEEVGNTIFTPSPVLGTSYQLYGPALDVPYSINVTNIDDISADNYALIVRDNGGKLYVNKKPLTITGIDIQNKEYDGTVNVPSDKIDLTHMVVSGYLADNYYDQSKIAVTATFPNANVGDYDASISLSISDNAMASRYTIANDSQSSDAASITQKNLTITAEDKNSVYGNANAVFTVEAVGFVNGEEPNNLSSLVSYTIKKNDETVTYNNSLPAGTYVIEPSGYTNDNYNIEFMPGTLTHAVAQLDTPSVKWEAGKASWDTVSGIGDVTVSGYTYVLNCTKLVDGSEVTSEVTRNTITNTEIDLLNTIRTNGAGKYTISVTANASLVNNDNHCNVLDSETTPVDTYAASVTVAFNDDTVTNAGKGAFIKIMGNNSYVVVAGEQGISMTATMVNPTGYQPARWGLNVPFTTSDLGYTSGTVDISAKLNVPQNLNTYEDVTWPLSLTSRNATLAVTLSVTPENGTTEYGYNITEGTPNVPVITANPAVSSSDNITTNDYTYTYTWMVRNENSVWVKEVEGTTSNSFQFPIGYAAATGIYRVYAIVTATRKDNLNSVTVNSPVMNITVTKAPFHSTVSMADWVFGATRSNPNFVTIEEIQAAINANPGILSFVYCDTLSENLSDWSPVIPKEVGTYYVRAKVAETKNYEAYITPLVAPEGRSTEKPYQFEITKATLNAPTMPGMAPSTTNKVPYGLMSWDTIVGPSENNGATDSLKTVGVEYETLLERLTGTDTWETIDTQTVEGTSLDIADKANAVGKYRFSVVAKSKDERNCNDSLRSAYKVFDVTVDLRVDVPTKVYNGYSVTLTADSNAVSGTKYEWYKDGVKVAETATNTYKFRNVKDSGRYYVVVNDSYVSTYVDVEITEAPYTATSRSKTQEYNGEPLTGLLDDITQSSIINEDGKVEVPVISGFKSITDFGTIDNEFTVSNSYDNNRNVVFDVDNYDIQTTFGTLSISRAPVTVTAVNKNKIYGQNDPTLTAVVSGLKHNEPDSTITYSISRATGENVVAGGYAIAPSGGAIQGNYTVTYVPATFTINKKSLTNSDIANSITVDDIAEITYDAGTHNPEVVVKYATESGDKTLNSENTDYSLSYSIDSPKNVGEYTITITAADNGNYKDEITKTFNIIRRNVTVVPDSLSKTFGDADPAVLTYEVTNLATGETKSLINATLTRAEGENVRTYPISCVNLETEQGNYNVEFDNTKIFTINPRSITAATIASFDNVVYDAHEHKPADITATYNSVTLVKDTDYEITYEHKSVNHPDFKDVGEVILHIKGINNFTGETSVSFNITRKKVTVTARSYSKVYGQLDPEFKVDVVGVVDDWTILYNAPHRKANDNDDAGKVHVIEVSGEPIQINYTVEYINGNLEIARKPITDSDVILENIPAIKEAGNTIVYSGGPCYQDVSAVYHAQKGDMQLRDGGMNDYVLHHVHSSDVGYCQNVGTVTVTVEGVKNYSGTRTITYDIVPKQVDIYPRSAEYTKVYGKADPEYKYTVEGVVGSYDIAHIDELIKASIDRHEDAGEDVGTYVVKVYAEEDQGNYKVVTHNATLTITKAPAFVYDIQDLSKTYDGTAVDNPTHSKITDEGVSATFSFRKIEDDGSITELTSAPKDAGTYSVVVTLPESKNYNPAAGEKDFVISPVSLTLTADDKEKTYGNADPELTYKITTGELVEGESLKNITVTRTAGENVDTYPITVNHNALDNPNYVISCIEGTFTINRSSAMVFNSFTQEELKHVYDGTNFSKEATTNDMNGTVITYSTDGVNYSAVLPSIKNVGDLTVYAKAENPNYSTITTEYTLSVTKRPASVTPVDASITFNDSEPEFTYTAENVVSGESLSGITVYTMAGSLAGEYELLAKQEEGANPNYELTFNKGKYTIAKKQATLNITSDPGKEYDKTPVANPTYTCLGESDVYFNYYQVNSDNTLTPLSAAPTDVGKYLVRASMAESRNYLAVSADKEFEIVKGVYDGTKEASTEAKYGHTSSLDIAGYNLPEGYAVGTSMLTDNDSIIASSSVDGTVVNYKFVNSADKINKTATYDITVSSKNYQDFTFTVTMKVIAKDEMNLKFAEAEVEKTYGDDKFINELSGVADGSTVKFTSSNPEVATVNETTGEITILHYGECVIKVEASETHEYAAASTQYTLKVNQAEYAPGWFDVNDKIDFSGVTTDIELPENWEYTEVTADFEPGSIITAHAAYTAADYDNYINYKKTFDIYCLAEIIDDITTAVYTIGIDTKAVIHCTGVLPSFVEVYVGNMDTPVDSSNYDLEDGSTIITFHKDYLDGFAVGIYDVKLKYNSCEVMTTLEIRRLPVVPDVGPGVQTGIKNTDIEDLLSWSVVDMILMACSLLVTVIALVRDKNTRKMTSLVLTLIMISIFVMTQNLSGKMILFDLWTLVMAILLLIEIGLLKKNAKEN